MAKLGGVEILQPDATYVGGLTEMRRTAALAKALGRRFIPHGYKSNLLLATNLAFLAQHDTEEWLEYSIAPSPLRWEMTREALPIGADGRVAVPTGAGLGVTLNEETVAKYRVG
jgi:L-alanine-DL-glutamate epimerase-like enolase superfamily enzyme